MTIRRINGGPGLPPGFPFALACQGNGVLFISGMPAVDSDGAFVGGTVLLSDIGNYADFNAWWRTQFPDPEMAPGRLTFQAGALLFDAKIELQVVAAAAEDA